MNVLPEILSLKIPSTYKLYGLDDRLLNLTFPVRQESSLVHEIIANESKSDSNVEVFLILNSFVVEDTLFFTDNKQKWQIGKLYSIKHYWFPFNTYSVALY